MGSLDYLRTACVSLVACWLSAGCGGDDAEATDAGAVEDALVSIDASVAARTVCQSVPGSRLSREYIEPSPGAREERRLIDTTHGTECRFLADGTDTYSCYPFSVGGSLFFTDENCTVPVILFPQGLAPNDFFRATTLPDLTCGLASYSHRKIGVKQAVPAALYEQRDTCNSVALSPAIDYYGASETLDATQFVSGTTQPTETTGRLSNYTFVGSDGSTTCRFGKIRDHNLETNCFPALATDQGTRCLPSGERIAGFFSDVACSVAVEAAPRNQCAAVQPFAYSQEVDACQRIAYAYKKVEPEVFDVRYEQGAECLNQFVDGTILDKVGVEVAAADFAEIQTVIEAGPGRLHRVIWAHAEDFGEFWKAWHDDRIDSDCTFQTATDGVKRCLPGSLKTANYFTTVDCTGPTRELAILDECQNASRYLTVGAGPGRRVFATTPYAGTAYLSGEAGCAAVAGEPLQRAHELAPSTFVRQEVLLD